MANDVRSALRSATEAVHARLHHHPAMLPLARGKIERGEYRDQLARLYGFHAPLEEALLKALADWNCGVEMAERLRVAALRQDLRALGVAAGSIERLPLAQRLPALSSPGRALGALYVREGSTLGGRMMARQLDHLLGECELDGRRFLTGGQESERLWRECCAALEQGAERGWLPDMLIAAQETFAAFEDWLDRSLEVAHGEQTA